MTAQGSHKIFKKQGFGSAWHQVKAAKVEATAFR